MRDLIKYLPVLKMAASKENYPTYAQYVHCGDRFVSTCDDVAFVKVDFDMPFRGNVNLFVLETILKTLPDEYKLETDQDTVKVVTKKTQYVLNIADLPFPELDRPDAEKFVIDEGNLEILKTSVNFTGVSEYENIYLDKDGLISTNGQRLFIYDQENILETPIMLNKKIISNLAVGYSIGVGDNGNVVIDFPDGYALFTTPHYSTYPAENIREWASKALPNTKPLINVGEFKDLLAKVNPIFFGEAKRFIHIENHARSLEITGESPFNGKAAANCKSDLKETFVMDIDADHFATVPNEYDLHVRVGTNDRIAAKNHVAQILLWGI